jgi:hypothetical protein
MNRTGDAPSDQCIFMENLTLFADIAKAFPGCDTTLTRSHWYLDPALLVNTEQVERSIRQWSSA